ncbi:hypothetical protein [Pseudonocardia sp. H11422]|uniref:hypothetical protein n=1 Tax=Pseudonocardia sp. H11422 TaxID=2835866 RepID=UPI001BDDC1AB|nr:hypothetical protein [Pseudonocardia sp. H11422]
MPRIAQEFADIPFATLVRGSVHRTTYPLTPELVASYDRLVGAAAGERAVVPPWLYCTFLPIYRAMGGRMEQGSVHIRQEVSQHGAARVGDVLDVAVTVTEATLRKGRPTVVLDTGYAREGEVICRVTSTILWGYASR